MAKRSQLPPRLARRKTSIAPEAITNCPLVLADTPERPLPGWIAPCLPTLTARPPVGANWIHEVKWDGYRISAYLESGKVTIRTRNGHDWTSHFPTIAGALARLKVKSAVIDGEAAKSRSL